MANRKRATSETQGQATSQRPDPISSAVPPPPSPAETPSPPATVVTMDQFVALVQQVQTLTQLVQGLPATPGLAVPAPRPHEEAASLAPPAISSSNPPRAADYHRQLAKARRAPQRSGGKSSPRSRRVCSPFYGVFPEFDAATAYQQRVARYHPTEARGKFFLPGGLVLRKASISKPLEQGKLSPSWEGPGTYKLQDLDGKSIPRMRNSDNLRIYHQ